jgi:hypothetical protein
MIGATAPATPITAVTTLLRGSDSDEAVLQAAFSEARRLRCELRALKLWQRPLDGNTHLAEAAEQKTLGNYLAGWQHRFPDVAVASALRPGEPLGSVVDHLATTDLLVLGLPDFDDAHEHLDALLDAVVPAQTHCTMLVPTWNRVLAAVGRGGETRAASAAV